jgi:hypothetical protein
MEVRVMACWPVSSSGCTALASQCARGSPAAMTQSPRSAWEGDTEPRSSHLFPWVPPK